MRSGSRDKTKNLALCAMLCAIGVVILYLGALIEVLDLSLAALAPIFVIYVAIELGGYWPWLVYLVTGITAILLLPQKFGAVIYLLFTGFYPMVKKWGEGKLPRFLALLVKLAVFHVSLVAAWLLIKLLMIPFSFTVAVYWAVAILEVTFLLYDFVLTRFISLYIYRWRSKLRLGRKK